MVRTTSLASRGVLVVLASLVLFLAGCDGFDRLIPSGAGKQSRGFTDYDGMQREYDEATRSLELPPGVQFRDDVLNAPAGGSFQVGVGASCAREYCLSAWEQEWLSQRGKDQARADKALAVLKAQFPLFLANYDEHGREVYRGYLKQAELGDPSGFQRDVTVNPVELVRVDE